MANNELNLEACPFCGGAARYLPKQEGFYVESAICDTCHLSMPPAIWNRRAAPAQGGLSDALPELPKTQHLIEHYHDDGGVTFESGYTEDDMHEYARAYGLLCRGQQGGVGDAADRDRLNWIEDQSDFGPIEITLGKGTRPNTTATYLTYGADDGSRISSGPARHVRAAIDQCKNLGAAIQAQAGDAKGGAA